MRPDNLFDFGVPVNLHATGQTERSGFWEIPSLDLFHHDVGKMDSRPYSEQLFTGRWERPCQPRDIILLYHNVIIYPRINENAGHAMARLLRYPVRTVNVFLPCPIETVWRTPNCCLEQAETRIEGDAVPNTRRRTVGLPRKTYWHLYSLQTLDGDKLAKIVNKILKKEYVLIK